MKTNLTRTLIMSAIALTGAAAAFAQDNVSAEIPFAFRAAGVKFDAGTYSISQFGRSDSGVLTLQNWRGGNTRFVNTTGPEGDNKYQSPKLVFRCGEDGACALSAIRLENGRTWTLRTPRMKPMETERIAVIYPEKKQAE